MSNFWDTLMGDDTGAAQYMDTYGEGPGCETRQVISSFIKDGETVLDVGCGPGWNYDHFKQYGPKVGDYLGLDYSERFVRVARKRAGSSVWFDFGDCRALKSPEGSWDVVILQDVLEHTDGYEVPILEALQVAKKRVIISFWKGSFRDGVDSEDQINDDGDDGYGATYNRQKFETYMDALGLGWKTCETSPAANRWHRFYVIEKGDGNE